MKRFTQKSRAIVSPTVFSYWRVTWYLVHLSVNAGADGQLDVQRLRQTLDTLATYESQQTQFLSIKQTTIYFLCPLLSIYIYILSITTSFLWSVVMSVRKREHTISFLAFFCDSGIVFVDGEVFVLGFVFKDSRLCLCVDLVLSEKDMRLGVDRRDWVWRINL